MAVRVSVDATTTLHQVVDERGESLCEANRFLHSLGIRGLSPNTVRAYAFDLVCIYRWLETIGKSLLDLREPDLVEFIAYQKDRGAKPRSINRQLNTCRLAYRFWADEEMKSGPQVNTASPHYRGAGRDSELGLQKRRRRHRLVLCVKIGRTLVEPLTVDEVRRFIASLKRYRDLAIVHLMLLCGLRSQEILNLDLDDVCLQRNHLRVHGKGGKQRMLPFSHALAQPLCEYLRLERPDECTTPRLFVALQGKRRGCAMTSAGLRSLFRYRRAHNDVARANPHRFRHTFGTEMARAGVRLPILQKMMGHAHCATTLQYINLSMADIASEYRRAIANIERRYRNGQPCQDDQA